MSLDGIVLVGAGPHAKVVVEAVQAVGRWDLVGLTDPQPESPSVLGVPVLGNDDVLATLRTKGVRAAVISVGDNARRARLAVKLRDLGFVLPPIVHPQAFVAPTARVEAGAVIMARAVVGTQALIQELAIVNTGAIIDHDCVIGKAAHIAPGCALAGSVRVGLRTLIGVGAAVRPGIVIGQDAVVAAGSAVVEDVPDGVRVGGVPARVIPAKSASST
jgi:UDP-perosamine 4-acetyltransferase